MYRYVAIKHEHETNNKIPKQRETNLWLYHNWKYRAAIEGLNVSYFLTTT